MNNNQHTVRDTELANHMPVAHRRHVMMLVVGTGTISELIFKFRKRRVCLKACLIVGDSS